VLGLHASETAGNLARDATRACAALGAQRARVVRIMLVLRTS
jgi:hypothetical protein